MIRCAILGHRKRHQSPELWRTATCTRCHTIFVRFDGYYVPTAFFGDYEPAPSEPTEKGNDGE